VLPIDIILVRHGQSEGNVVHKASRKGDNRLFTQEFRNRHSRMFRLTDKGISQATKAGQWLADNVPMPLDRFYVSDYLRAQETAALLGLPNALWRVEYQLRERDRPLDDNMPDDERRRRFALEQRQWELDRVLAYPAGGGESIVAMCLRLKADFLEHIARECGDMRIVVVCHGHVMRGLQMELEHLGHDDFLALDESNNPKDKIRNCQILWYTRRDPGTQELRQTLVAVRSVCPWDPSGDYGWRRISRKLLTNAELMGQVTKHPRLVAGC
jgi:broad specificity phosphatase PhoE